jgi:K+-transporting ATPase A subunit
MTAIGWAQVALFFVIILALTRPLGSYMFHVFEGERQPLPRVLGPVERLLLRLTGVEAKREQTWGQYTLAMLAFNLLGVLILYAIQRLQHVLPFNPQGFGAVGEELAFNTASSFTTNTNWQSYAGETTLSYFSQLLMTRGTLTTFSIANDVAKYFAILPALFMAVFPEIAPLNVMRLTSPYSAILSAVVFNALIIILLIPLALRGVKYRPVGAAALLQRNMLVYGVGGLIAPFVGIKLIDVVLTAVGLA